MSSFRTAEPESEATQWSPEHRSRDTGTIRRAKGKGTNGRERGRERDNGSQAGRAEPEAAIKGVGRGQGGEGKEQNFSDTPEAPANPLPTPEGAPDDSLNAFDPTVSQAAGRVGRTKLFLMFFDEISVRLQGVARQASHCGSAGPAQIQSGLGRAKPGKASSQVLSTMRTC